MKYSVFSELSQKSLGRYYRESEDKNRSCFMRDRDRIIHSTSFRKLKYKTQVFVHHEADYYRTRLSHSIEVSQLARSISRIFKVNEDLSETIALAHDLGHTPFGHAGEEALNKKLENYGGFDHNMHVLKILIKLEKRYLNFDGLNLSWESLDGILKHNGPLSSKKKIPIFLENILEKFNSIITNNSGFEAQVAAISDDIAYNNNDIDDGLHAKLFSIDEISETEIVSENLKKIKIKNVSEKKDRIKYELVRSLIKNMIDNLEMNTYNNLKKFKPKNPNDVKCLGMSIVNFSEEMINKERELKLFLNNKMYNHPTVKTMTFKAKKIISDLFDLFVNEPQLLPEDYGVCNSEKELHINVGDYIAAMTDKNAIMVHKKYFNLYDFNAS